MCPANFSGPSNRLLIHEKRADHSPHIGQPKSETLVESGANGAATHFVERIAVPPAVHVRLAKTKSTGCQNTAKETGVVNRDIPRSSAVYVNVGDRKKIAQEIFGSRHGSNKATVRRHPSLFNRSCSRSEQVSGKVKEEGPVRN